MLRPPWPRAWWYASATFIAVSTDSEPELTKKIRLRSPGVSSAMRVASSNCFGMRAQERRAEVELPQLGAYRVGDLLAPVAGGDAEQPRRRVDDLVAAVVPEVHPFRADDHLRIGLEFPVRRERHPVLVERNALRTACSWIVSSAWPIVVSFVGFAQRRASSGARAAYARIKFESYTFATRDAACIGAASGESPGRTRPDLQTVRDIPMRVGVPKEIKVLENRVGLVPGSVRELVAHGHAVVVEHNAGQGIGMDDDTYRKAGATVVATAAEVFAAADMIVKVKEPQAVERKMLRQGQILFTYLHLAPDPGAGGRSRRERRGVHRLRDRDVGHRRVAAARADVRGRGPDGRAGGRVLPREAARRARHAAGRRAGRGSGEGRDPGRRRRRLARVPHRARDGRRSVGARPQRRRAARAVAAIRPSAQHRVLDARRGRESRDERGSRHRRRAHSRRVGAEARLGGAREADEARIGRSSTSRSTRAAASRRRVRRRTPTPSMSSTASRTTAWRTCPAACRARRRSRSTMRRCRSCWRSPERDGSRRSPTTRTCATASTSRSAR